MEILDRERIGIMERQSAELWRHSKRDLNEIVEVGLTRDVAQAADIVGLERPQRSEAIEHHAGLRANDVPVHLKQSASSRMKEEVYAFSFSYGAVASESQRIDPME
jgi:hypothetical protein